MTGSGPGRINDTANRFGIAGTDLRIMWDNGIQDDFTTAVDEHYSQYVNFVSVRSWHTPGRWTTNYSA